MTPGVKLEALIRPPRVPSPRPPLLVLLHGVGADEEDLLPVAAALDPRFLVASLRAPHEALRLGYAWYALDWSTTPPGYDATQARSSVDALVATLPRLAEANGADPARTFLLGFSQGAVMALEVALARPDLVRGAVLHSGRALPGVLRRAAPDALLRGLELLVVHGTEDAVLPVGCSREIRDLLAPVLDDRLTYRERPGGHEVTGDTLADVQAWLSARLGAGPAAGGAGG